MNTRTNTLSMNTVAAAAALVTVCATSPASAGSVERSVEVWGYYRASNRTQNSPVVSASTDGYITALLLEDGALVMEGMNLNDQCAVPGMLEGAVEVVAEAGSVLVRFSDGIVRCWTLGIECDPMPELVDVVSMARGGSHTLVVDASGAVTCWGSNSAGQCTPPIGLGPVSQVAAGAAHSVALVQGGTVV